MAEEKKSQDNTKLQMAANLFCSYGIIKAAQWAYNAATDSPDVNVLFDRTQTALKITSSNPTPSNIDNARYELSDLTKALAQGERKEVKSISEQLSVIRNLYLPENPAHKQYTESVLVNMPETLKQVKNQHTVLEYASTISGTLVLFAAYTAIKEWMNCTKEVKNSTKKQVLN